MKRDYSTGLFLGAIYFLSTLIASSQSIGLGSDSTSRSSVSADTTRRLFAFDSAVSFTLIANLRVIMKDRGEKPITHSALLTYTDGRQQPVSLPLTLKVRGNFRRDKNNCWFPPLLVDFPKKKVKNTLFAHQNKLKLVTHCQFDEWVVREYLIYKLYNLLTDMSFRAQLARVTYVDSLGKRPPETHWAFLLEDDDDLAKRNKTKISIEKYVNADYADSVRMATVAVFEYMIGNTDWSVPYLHNIRLLDNGPRRPIPVPYDFDHSGIVEASYAKPAEQLGIASVRQRLYRCIAYPMPILQQVFDKFNQVKPQFYALYQNDTRLDKTYIKRTLKYLDEFYALIKKPAQARFVFSPNAQSDIVIKGLK